MPSPATIFASIQRAGLDELQPLYQAALSKQAQGGNAQAEWDAFAHTLARVYILSSLTGRASAIMAARRQGIRLEFQNPKLVAGDVHYAVGDRLITAPFTEAINFFTKLVPNLRHVVNAMTPLMKQQAFYVTGIESKDALTKLKDRLMRSLTGAAPEGQEHPSQQSFIDWAGDKIARALGRARLETVYRTNVMGALNQGRLEQQQSEDLRPHIALTMYDATHDRRARPTHLKFDTFVAPPDDPIWQTVTPPCGFRCRCTTHPLTWEKAMALGFADGLRNLNRPAIDAHNAPKLAMVNAGQFPDPGFE